MSDGGGAVATTGETPALQEAHRQKFSTAM
jgi:hypothetical protein